ncbi:MAG: amino acid ABC transporter permease [Leptothrix sp. (in: Bacteria)]|nr:amino acid ABC transporter permease [Leptothrix sp. (in: b-proteobacteria)]
MKKTSATSRAVSAFFWLALAYAGWRLLDWGVLNAVFRPDEAACHALERTGACWGVITEKIRPLLLGRYPHDEQWRPSLALLMMLLGAGALLWRPWALSLQGLVWGTALVSLAVAVLMHGGPLGLPVVPSDQWGGLPLTLILAGLTMALSLPLGIALALGRRARWPWVRWACSGFIEVTRGVPLVMVLFMAAFMLPAIIPARFEVSLLWRVLIALTLFSAAYLAEIVRGGLQTVGSDQFDAAKVMGLSGWQTQRLVVLPQALRAVLPALVNHAIGLLKDTSLVMVVSLHELTGALSLSLGGDPQWRPYYLEGYLFVAAIYAALCLSLSRAGRRVEQRWLVSGGQA